MSEIVVKKLRELEDLRRKIIAYEPDRALSIIMDQKQPEILVRSFNPEDLHILIKEIGVEDALPVLQMATDEQWAYILDMESWDKDRLDFKALSAWLRFLYLADSDRFIKQAVTENLELMEVWLQKNIDVVIRDHDEDLSHLSRDFFTLDDIFYVRVKSNSATLPPDSIGDLDRVQFIGEFLNRLADEDYAKYQGLLLEVSSLLGAETEEELYRVKTGRLEEKGVPSLENAMSIYTMLPAENLAERKTVNSNFKLNPPLLPAILAQNQARMVPDLSPARLTLPPDFEQEFAALANSILVADQIKITQRKDMEQAVSKAVGYLRIAFEILQKNHKLNPVQAINLYATGQLFTFGFSQALKLKWQAQSWLKQSFIVANKLGLKFFDEEGMGVLSGLMLKRPLCYNALGHNGFYGEFTSLNDIVGAAAVLNEIIAIDTLLTQTGLKVPLAQKTQEHYPLTWKNLLLTLWARHELAYEDTPEPIAIAALKTFWPNLFSNGVLNNTANAKFSGWLCQKAVVSSLNDHAQRAVDKLFRELAENYGTVAAHDLDAKHINLFRIING